MKVQKINKESMLCIDMVREFHEKFNLGVATKINLEDKKLRVSLIREELDELIDALADNDVIEVADAIGDLLYVVIGSALSFGLPLGRIFKDIHISNMSKASKSKESLGKTLAKYKALGVECYGEGMLVKSKEGKLLKSVDYKQVDLSYLIK